MDNYLEESLGFILNRTNTKYKNALLQRYRAYDITPEQLSALNCLWAQEGITPKEVSKVIFKDKPNTNRILEKLQAKGLVVREPHPADSRAFQLFLTARGWAIRDELIPIARKLQREVTEGMEEYQLNELKRLLNLIHSNMEHLSP